MDVLNDSENEDESGEEESKSSSEIRILNSSAKKDSQRRNSFFRNAGFKYDKNTDCFTRMLD
jgi:hypothetical protein